MTSISITQLLKNPHSIQAMIEEGENLAVFSISKLVFEIHPPAQNQVLKNNKNSSKKQTQAKTKDKKKFVLPTISVPIKGSLSRSEIYSKNSWLDKPEQISSNIKND